MFVAGFKALFHCLPATLEYKREVLLLALFGYGVRSSVQDMNGYLRKQNDHA